MHVLLEREYSVKESVYHIMHELWLRKMLSAVICANIDLPGKRMEMILSGMEIAELPVNQKNFMMKLLKVITALLGNILEF